MGLPCLWFIFLLLVLTLVFFESLREIFGVRVLAQVGIKLPFEKLHEEGLAAAPPAQTIERA